MQSSFEDDANLVAHSPNSAGNWHTLRDHAIGTANLARQFGDEIGMGEYCYNLGILHDAGKSSCSWQETLSQRVLEQEQGKPRRPVGLNHKDLGAIKAATEFNMPTAIIPLLGHHGGMSDLDLTKEVSPKTVMNNAIAQDLFSRNSIIISTDWKLSQEQLEAWIKFRNNVPEGFLFNNNSKSPLSYSGAVDSYDRLRHEFGIRMAYSCLVDADFLDTRYHFDNSRPQVREQHAFDESFKQFEKQRADKLNGRAESKLDELRAEVYERCLSAAIGKRGFYTITAPTGYGKTYSSLAFALNHAAHNEMKRVIYSAPFINIIEQTASEYGDLLGAENVLEDHSMIQEQNAPKLMYPNWDSPFVVTTMVKLLESILNNKPSHCRKLHNIANSVIILDEVQSLPRHLMKTVLNVLDLLVVDYGCTVVFCSATTPEFSMLEMPAGSPKRKVFDIITADKTQEMIDRGVKPRHSVVQANFESIEEVAQAAMDAKGSVLLIVNTVADCQKISKLIQANTGNHDDRNLLSLSTRLVSAHRKRTVDQAKSILSKGDSLIMVSTQVIEAGVDLDFQNEFRQLAPIESLHQSAGRCNREGNRTDSVVTIFTCAVMKTPPGSYSADTKTAKRLLREMFSNDNGDDYRELFYDNKGLQSVFTSYVKSLNSRPHDMDTAVEKHRRRLNFKSTSQAFQVIQDQGKFDWIMSDGTKEGDRVIQDAMEYQDGKDLPTDWWSRASKYSVSLNKQHPIQKKDRWLPLKYSGYDALVGYQEDSDDILF